jgi:hypothetical protein
VNGARDGPGAAALPISCYEDFVIINRNLSSANMAECKIDPYCDYASKSFCVGVVDCNSAATSSDQCCTIIIDDEEAKHELRSFLKGSPCYVERGQSAVNFNMCAVPCTARPSQNDAFPPVGRSDLRYVDRYDLLSISCPAGTIFNAGSTACIPTPRGI